MSHDADDTDLSARTAVQRTNQDVGPIGIPQEQRLAQTDRRFLARGQRHRAVAVQRNRIPYHTPQHASPAEKDDQHETLNERQGSSSDMQTPVLQSQMRKQ